MKSAKSTRIGAAVLGLLICLGGAVTHTSAAQTKDRLPSITLNGEEYSGKVKLKDGVTYVKIREFSENLGAHVTWDRRNESAVVSYRGINTTLGHHVERRKLQCFPSRRESLLVYGGRALLAVPHNLSGG